MMAMVVLLHQCASTTAISSTNTTTQLSLLQETAALDIWGGINHGGGLGSYGVPTSCVDEAWVTKHHDMLYSKQSLNSEVT